LDFPSYERKRETHEQEETEKERREGKGTHVVAVNDVDVVRRRAQIPDASSPFWHHANLDDPVVEVDQIVIAGTRGVTKEFTRREVWWCAAASRAHTGREQHEDDQKRPHE
jgi:hypothetical protein